MTKDGVRDFMAAEYTLSENYVHGLAAFGPRLKKFRKPAFLPGLKPRASCGKFCEAPREKALGYVCGIQVKRALVPAVFENKRGFANTAAAGLKLISEAPWKTRSRAAWG